MDTTQQLPQTVETWTTAHLAHDADAALPLLTPDAVITDNGESFSGEESLRDFIANAGTEFTYTDTLTGSRREDDGTWVVSHHLEGDFPGGVADLDYRFRLAGDRIERLDIVAV
jgi:hypothetical protein